MASTTITRGRALRLSTAEPVDARPADPGAVVLMTEAEARAATARIVAGLDGLREQIADLDAREGWRVLGYDSFRAWALAEVPEASVRHVYRLRDAAEVDRDLGVTIGHTPEAHARALKATPAEERRAVVGRADEIAQQAGRPRQAADVRQAAQERAGSSDEARPAPRPDPYTALVNDLDALQDRQAAGAVADGDLAEADRLIARLDALEAEAGRAYPDARDQLTDLRAALAPTPPAAPTLPAGWAWREGIEPNPADGRPLWQARRFDGHQARASHDLAEAAQNAAWSERRNPPLTVESEWAQLTERAAALPGGSLRYDQLTHVATLSADRVATVRAPGRAELIAALGRYEIALSPTPPEFSQVVARAAAAGCALSRDEDGYYRLAEPGGTTSRYPQWLSALGRVRHFETGGRPAEPPAPAAAETETEPDEGADYAEVYDEDGALAAQVLAVFPPTQARLDQATATAIAEIAQALRLMSLGQAHAVDTPLLDDLGRALSASASPARGTLIAVLELVAGDAEELCRRGA